MTPTTTNGTSSTINDIGVGLVSVGWMGKLHSRAYQAVPYVYPDTGIRPRLVHAADTAPDRVVYAREVLGYERGSAARRKTSSRGCSTTARSASSWTPSSRLASPSAW